MGRRLPRSAPREQGVSARGILDFLDALADGPEVHSLMVLRHGVVVAQGWWEPYRPDAVHDMFSLSKSFTSTAVGLAQAEGLLSVDDLVLDHVGDLAPADPDPNLARMRIRHLLSMTTGHHDACDEVTFSSPDWARAFLTIPPEHEPGSHFVYNTAASYLLSVIVQRLTGRRLLDYLGPRLLSPLGIEDARWEQSPSGVDAGGFGLFLTTEDIACFSQLYLDDWVWQGRRLLPEGWVKEATRAHGPEQPGDSEWDQGYGYQFWRGHHGTYRSDGAFAQLGIVLPDQDAVIAITAGAEDNDGLFERIWTHLLPALAEGPDDDDVAADALVQRLAGLRMRPPAGDGLTVPDGWLGRTITLGANPLDVQSAVLAHDDAGLALTLGFAAGAQTLRVGDGEWVRGTLQGGPDGFQEVAAAGALTGPDTLTVQVRPYQSPFCLTLETTFAGESVGVAARLNVSFGPTELGTFTGRLT